MGEGGVSTEGEKGVGGGQGTERGSSGGGGDREGEQQYDRFGMRECMGLSIFALMGENQCVVHGVVFPDAEHVDCRAVDHLCGDGTVMYFETTATSCVWVASFSPSHTLSLSFVCCDKHCPLVSALPSAPIYSRHGHPPRRSRTRWSDQDG